MTSNPKHNTLSTLQKKLHQALAPTFLEIIDEGEKHRGHANEGAGHFAVRISSPLFEKKPLLECHRLVYAALGDTMRTEIHALKIDILF